MNRIVFAVCDPLSRRYTLLPQIPIGQFYQVRCGIKPFLVPASDEETETSFKVVCAEKDAAGLLVAFVFSSATEQWSSLAMGAAVRSAFPLPLPRGYAYGCFYWYCVVDRTDNLIMLNTRSMEFSLVRIPFRQHQRNFVIVEAGGNRLGMFTLDNSIISAVSHLVYAIQEIDENGSISWRIERRVRLPLQHYFSFEDLTDRYLLLRGTPWYGLLEFPNVDGVDTGYFSFGFESMQIEKMCSFRFRNDLLSAKLYPGFPPSLCLQSL